MANDDRRERRADADALVVRARTDREAFGTLYDRYYDRILRYCARRLFLRAEAEDACSEAFLYVAGHFDRFRGDTEAEFRCWLYQIATNTIHHHLRTTRRREEIMRQAIEQGELGTATSSNPEPLDWPRCYEAIGQLRLREQAIVTLRFFEELSHDEIAASLEMSPGAVRVALSRAIEKLRRQLLPQRNTT